MSLTQLGARLGYPKSSLSVLLKSMVAQGYLSVDRSDGDFFPTLRVAQLGDWVAAALLGSEAILPALEKLRDETGETVTLTMASGLEMRCLRAFIGVHPISLQVEEGISFPMMGTAIGTAYLAALAGDERARTFQMWRKQGASESEAEHLANLVAESQASGIASAYDAVLPDTGAIAMAVRSPLKTGDPIMVVAVAGLSSRIHAREAECTAIMRATMAEWSV